VAVGIKEAFLALRSEYGESQQAFANRLGISIRAVANYEKDRVPRGKTLYALEIAAEQAGRKDLSAIFEDALQAELGRGIPLRVFDRLQRPLLQAQLLAHQLRHAPEADRERYADDLAKHIRETLDIVERANPMSSTNTEEDQ
jgi:transcriptional regulator with XRE-family HTH domain